METIIVRPYGYCSGVQKAIKMVKDLKRQNPEVPVYIYGMLIHNRSAIEELKQIGIITIEKDSTNMENALRTLPRGIMVTTAHGTSEKEVEIIKKLGFTYIDGTCKIVATANKNIKNAINSGMKIIYLGKKNHPEANASISISPVNTIFIQNIEDLDHVALDVNQHYAIAVQTTIPNIEIMKVLDYLSNKHISYDVLDNSCNANSYRQKVLMENIDDADIALIIGDKHSNNSVELYQLAKEKLSKTYFISNVSEIDSQWFDSSTKIALVASGVSSSNEVFEAIITYLKLIK